MSLEDAERRLAAARARVRAIAEFATINELSDAWGDVESAERELARLRGEEYAVPIDLGVRWDIGAPMPHVVAASGRALVLFYRAVPNETWDGTSVEVVDPTSDQPAALGLIEFIHVHSIKFGGPNDEAIEGHPLSGRGLSGYRAHQVIDSRWIAEEERINSVHPMHRGGWHQSLNHYVLCFHDDLLECLAEGWRTELLTCSLPEALHRAARRVLR
jgi:hypothetical protein